MGFLRSGVGCHLCYGDKSGSFLLCPDRWRQQHQYSVPRHHGEVEHQAEASPAQSVVFHGIVPGLSHSPIGKIKIDVLFGDKDHFCREPFWFEVVDLEIPYHALLGRPTLRKFMAVPHYANLKMKMLGIKGIITIAGDYKKSAA